MEQARSGLEGPHDGSGVTPEMMRAYRRKWYAGNQEQAKTKVLQRRRELQEFIDSLKSTRSCARCGEQHPACLDFYPHDTLPKPEDSTTMIRNGWSKEHILSTVSRCQVLCANCHSKRIWDAQRHTSPTFAAATT